MRSDETKVLHEWTHGRIEYRVDDAAPELLISSKSINGVAWDAVWHSEYAAHEIARLALANREQAERIERLEAALAKHGTHEPSCSVPALASPTMPVCDCGLRAALESK